MIVPQFHSNGLFHQLHIVSSQQWSKSIYLKIQKGPSSDLLTPLSMQFSPVIFSCELLPPCPQGPPALVSLLRKSIMFHLHSHSLAVDGKLLQAVIWDNLGSHRSLSQKPLFCTLSFPIPEEQSFIYFVRFFFSCVSRRAKFDSCLNHKSFIFDF